MRTALPLLAVSLAGAVASAALGGSRVYRNDAWRVRAFEVPRNWEAAPQASYPALLVLAVGPEGARLSLAAQRVARGVRARGMADAAAATLTRQGFREARVSEDADGRARLDALFDGGRSRLRQVYAVFGDLGFVVTLTAPVTQSGRFNKELEEAARSLQIASPAEVPVDGGAGDGA